MWRENLSSSSFASCGCACNWVVSSRLSCSGDSPWNFSNLAQILELEELLLCKIPLEPLKIGFEKGKAKRVVEVVLISDREQG